MILAPEGSALFYGGKFASSQGLEGLYEGRRGEVAGTRLQRCAIGMWCSSATPAPFLVQIVITRARVNVNQMLLGFSGALLSFQFNMQVFTVAIVVCWAVVTAHAVLPESKCNAPARAARTYFV